MWSSLRLGLLGVGVALAVPAQDFVPVKQAVPAARPMVSLGADARLVLVAGALQLHAGAVRQAVACTASEGAGTVHTIAQGRSGTVFVAASNGLFVLDAAHPVLDPMDLRDGVPPGEPRGLLLDGDRLWLCTDRAFGVVDVRFGFGRTFGAEDGVPAGPFAGLARGDDGRLLLAARDGTFAYEPDVGPPPQSPDGAIARPALVATPDGRCAVDLAVVARGGATLRQRRQHDHQLRGLDGDSLHGLRPGRHTVEVHAVDRDLRRTVVAVAAVSVPLATVFDPRVLPALAAAAAALVFVLAFRAARSVASRRRRFVSAAGASALLCVCGLQVLAALLGYGRSWPFVGFSMYTENWHQDAVLYKPRLWGQLADGSLVPEGEGESGLLQDGYWQMLAEVVFGGAAAQREFLTGWNARRPAELPRLVGFRLVDGRIRLSRAGPVDVAPTVLVQYEER